MNANNQTLKYQKIFLYEEAKTLQNKPLKSNGCTYLCLYLIYELSAVQRCVYTCISIRQVICIDTKELPIGSAKLT